LRSESVIHCAHLVWCKVNNKVSHNKSKVRW